MEETQILTNHASGARPLPARNRSPRKDANILESSFARVHMRRKRIQQVLFMLFRMAAIINGIGLFVVVFFIAGNGWKAITWEFSDAGADGFHDKRRHTALHRGNALPGHRGHCRCTAHRRCIRHLPQ